MNCTGKIFISFFILTSISCAQCEIITIGLVGSALGGLGYYGYEYVKCKYQECCTDEYIHLNFDKLEYMFAANLYGQQIAHKTITLALRGYFGSHHSSKALVMSFHGTPGTGKNYVAQMIATALYKNGVKSQYYHFFNGRNDFPLQQKVIEYQEELKYLISKSLKECERSMFVFDEVDKMPEGLLNVLVPFLDYNSYHKSSKHSESMYLNKAIFIFLSNTGSSYIVQRLINMWENGKKREDAQLQDFEKLVADGAFTEKGGFHHSDAIQTSVIDHYVPFLPLEERHVKLCVEKAFVERGMISPTEKMIEEALSHLSFGPKPYNLYSMAGCKRIEQKVATIVFRKQSEDLKHKVKHEPHMN